MTYVLVKMQVFELVEDWDLTNLVYVVIKNVMLLDQLI